MKLFVGLDVSSFDIKVCFLDGEGHELKSFTVSNDLPGITRLRDEILESTKSETVSELRIGFESTSVYSFHPSMFLLNDESLRALGGQVLVMNPKQISNFKKSYSDMDKTDEIDAFIIADYLRFGRLPVSFVREEQYVALQQLTRARYHIVRQQTKEKQRFLQYLDYKCSAFTEEVESSVFGKAMTDLFLENYSIDELANIPLEDLANYLREKGKNRFPDPESVAKSIQKAVKTSYRLDKVVEDSIDTILGTSITLIRTFKKQITELDKAIKRIMKAIPQTLQSIPGMGPVFTAGIIAEIGQIERFADETKIAKYAGLYWRRHQSGRFTAEDTSLSRMGNEYLRYYLVEAANQVRRNVPEFGEYYAKKFKEVPKHQHKRAIVLTARKFVRLVDALLRKNQIYTPKRSVNI